MSCGNSVIRTRLEDLGTTHKNHSSVTVQSNVTKVVKCECCWVVLPPPSGIPEASCIEIPHLGILGGMTCKHGKFISILLLIVSQFLIRNARGGLFCCATRATWEGEISMMQL